MNCIAWIVDRDWSDALAELENNEVLNIEVSLIGHYVDQSIFRQWERSASLVVDSDILQKGVFPNEFKDEIYYSSLTNNSISDYSDAFMVADVMMDRIDPFPDDSVINPFERRYYIKKMFSFWEKIIEEYNIDTVIINESPHGWHTYTLFAIAKQRDIKFLSLASTIFPTLKAISEELGFPSIPLDNKLFAMVPKKELLQDFQIKVEKIRKDYSEAVPLYMIDQESKSSTSKLNFWMSRIFQFIKGFNTEVEQIKTYFTKTLDRSCGIGINSNNYFIKEVLERKKKKRKLKLLETKYKKVSVVPDFREKYIYFPMHYQPERTSNPEGLYYEDQLMLINLLEKILPEKYFIYVKEHKSQFYTVLNGNQGRWDKFYEKCYLSSRVKLINIDSDPFQLLDYAQAIVVLTGTAGFEGLCRNKKVISFGKNWYRSFYGVLDCSNEFNVNDFLTFLREKKEIDVMLDIKKLIEKSIYLSNSPDHFKLATILQLSLLNDKLMFENFDNSDM